MTHGNMNRKEIEFEFERATKNTYRFPEKSEGKPSLGHCTCRNQYPVPRSLRR